MSPAFLPAAARDALPWKNGGGLAIEVLWTGAGDADVPFDWRITIATIERDGAFSDFTGVDRLLMSAGQDGLTLVVDGGVRRLAPYEVLAFPGEAAVTSSGVARPTTALNLMLRRGAATGTLEALHVAEELTVDAAGDEVVAIVMSGELRAHERDLALHDAVRWSGGSVAFAGSGSVAIARIIGS